MQVKEFYDQLGFPGMYTKADLDSYGDPIANLYLRRIDQELGSDQLVLDAGCGTGLTTNLFALRYPTSRFVGIDFARSIDRARDFARENRINNVSFLKQDLSRGRHAPIYDRIICQGVLHHIPNYVGAAHRLSEALAPGGRLIVGLYHPAGKWLKRFTKINYGSSILEQDQEANPFELAFTPQQAQALFPDLTLVSLGPNLFGSTSLAALANSKSGGLTIYVFEKAQNEVD